MATDPIGPLPRCLSRQFGQQAKVGFWPGVAVPAVIPARLKHSNSYGLIRLSQNGGIVQPPTLDGWRRAISAAGLRILEEQAMPQQTRMAQRATFE